MKENREQVSQTRDRRWVHAVDFAWLVIDAQDEVALFYSDAASCPLGAQLLYSESEYRRIARTIHDSIEDRGSDRMEASSERASRDARKGFYVYQFSLKENAFKRSTRPGTPIKWDQVSRRLDQPDHMRVSEAFTSKSSASLPALSLHDRTGGKLTLPITDVPTWDEFSPFLKEASSLRDIYAYAIGEDDWKTIEEIMRRFGQVSHRIGERRVGDMMEILRPDEEGIGITAIAKEGLLINCHHFDAEEFEADISPREISRTNYKMLFEFMNQMSAELKKPVYLCEESSPAAIIFSTYAGLNVKSLDALRNQNPGQASLLKRIKSILG